MILRSVVIRRFKRFEDIRFEVPGHTVVVGPNNSGKTTALQALALWSTGLKRWNEKRAGERAPEKRPGVALNRRDLIAVPVPEVAQLKTSVHVPAGPCPLRQYGLGWMSPRGCQSISGPRSN